MVFVLPEPALYRTQLPGSNVFQFLCCVRPACGVGQSPKVVCQEQALQRATEKGLHLRYAQILMGPGALQEGPEAVQEPVRNFWVAHVWALR